MAELILQAQKALDEDNLEAYERLQKVIRDKYLEEEGYKWNLENYFQL